MMQLQLQTVSGGGRICYLLPPTLSPPPPPPHFSSSNFSHWRCRCFSPKKNRDSWSFPTINAIGLVAAAVVLATPPPSEETLSNIPSELSSEPCDSNAKECQQSGKKRIQHPKSRNAERCTSKCVTTCIQGGDGSPGEGPLNVRRPIIVFKQGFRTRQYCLVECSDICNLLEKAEKHP